MGSAPTISSISNCYIDFKLLFLKFYTVAVVKNSSCGLGSLSSSGTLGQSLHLWSC